METIPSDFGNTFHADGYGQKYCWHSDTVSLNSFPYQSGESDAASGSSLRCDFWKFHGKYPELPVSPAASVRFYHQSALTGDLRHSASGDSRYH